jgi:hypothetical protein
MIRRLLQKIMIPRLVSWPRLMSCIWWSLSRERRRVKLKQTGHWFWKTSSTTRWSSANHVTHCGLPRCTVAFWVSIGCAAYDWGGWLAAALYWQDRLLKLIQLEIWRQLKKQTVWCGKDIRCTQARAYNRVFDKQALVESLLGEFSTNLGRTVSLFWLGARAQFYGSGLSN